MLDVDAFLASESRAWRGVNDLVARCSRDDLLAPGACGDWSPRDILVHIACWHRWMADRLNSYASGLGKLETLNQERIDAMNAEFVARFAEWPVESVLVLSRDEHTRGVVAIRAAAFRGYDETWEGVIRANTTGHYEEHVPQLEAFLKERT